MSRQTTFGFALPQSYPTAEEATRRLNALIEKIDRSPSIGSIWVQEQTLGTDPSYEPLVSLAYVAARTTHARLATATVVSTARHPVLLAKQVAGLDQLSLGRLTLGLSIGDNPSVLTAFGVDLADRVDRFEETLSICRQLWTGQACTAESWFGELNEVSIAPLPVQQPLPVWFGAGAKPALRRTARLADGWVAAGGSSTSTFRGQLAYLEDQLAAAGRHRDEFTVAKKVYLHVDDSELTAKTMLNQWFREHWGSVADPDALFREVGIWGTPDQVCEQIEEVAASGADLIILNPVSEELEQSEDLIAIAQTMSPPTEESTV